MPNPVIDELTQLAPRIKAALEAERQADQVRQERITQAEAILTRLAAGLETVAGEIATATGVDVAVASDSTAIDALRRKDTDPGSPALQWQRGLRFTLAFQNPPSASLNSVVGARLYADGQLQMVAAHLVGQRSVWFGERLVGVTSAGWESAAAELVAALNASLPTAVEQLSDLLPA